MSKKNSIVRLSKRILREDKKARSTFDSFANLEAKLGVGQDNLTTGGTYGFNPISRQRMLLEWMHRGSWIAGVAVDIVAEDMTRAGVSVKGNLPPEDAEAIREKIIHLKIWQRISQTIKWARLYGGAVGVLLFDGQDPATPLKLERVGSDQFKGILVLDRWQVEPSLNNLVSDLGPDLGLPKFYRVMQTAPAYRGKSIHYSRVLRLTGIDLPFLQMTTENMWSISVLERLYDRMVAFDSATQGAAQLVYKAYIRTYSIEGLREVATAGGKAMDGLAKYVDMMRRFQSLEGVTLLDAKDKFEGHTHTAFAGLSDALIQFGQQLSGALQIPLVRLFGQSPAGLNSTGESDLRMYYDGILQKQENDLRIPMTSIYRAVAQSLDIDIPDGFTLSFNPLWQLTDKEKAEIANQDESTVQAAHEGGLITRKTALQELRQSSETTGRFSNISDADIDSAEEELPPLPTDVEVAAIKEGEEVPEGRTEPKQLAETNDRKRSRDSATSQLAWNTGLYMVVETPKGTIRRGYGWECTMPADYGYIRAATGADGDQLDAYLGPDPSSSYVLVIDQLTKPNGAPAKFDEHKVMLGYPDKETALSDYVLSYSDGKGAPRIGAATEMSIDQFKKWMQDPNNLKKPLGDLNV